MTRAQNNAMKLMKLYDTWPQLSASLSRRLSPATVFDIARYRPSSCYSRAVLLAIPPFANYT